MKTRGLFSSHYIFFLSSKLARFIIKLSKKQLLTNFIRCWVQSVVILTHHLYYCLVFVSLSLHEKCPISIISVNFRFQPEYGKIRTRKTPYLDTFHALCLISKKSISQLLQILNCFNETAGMERAELKLWQ